MGVCKRQHGESVDPNIGDMWAHGNVTLLTFSLTRSDRERERVWF